jgi:hypothetical protein
MSNSIDPQNQVASLASKFINNTSRHIFLTGKAGTGKTTFLKHIINHTHKNAVIAAPTGIAAINAGGVTLHSLFQLPFGGFLPVKEIFTSFPENVKLNTPQTLLKNLQLNNEKRRLLQELDLLIIDEVSMLRADLLDAIDTVLRSVRKKHYLPFGGVQILFIGDLLQLPPVVKEDEWRYLGQYYNSAYFFDAIALQQNKPVYIEFDKIYRQQDDAFIRILNNLRTNEITAEDIETLNQFYKPGFNAESEEGFIHLTTHNSKADRINREALQRIEGPSFFYKAVIQGEFSPYAYPVEEVLEFKKGAQVMFIKNDPTGERRFFNGKIGFVSDLSDEKIIVTLDDYAEPISVDRYTWANNRYRLNETTQEIIEEEAGSFNQYPLRLAWAITIHKSQGLTFKKAIIDVGSVFVSGQAYVALSRLVSLDGLVLTSPVRINGLTPDNAILRYADNRTGKAQLSEVLDKESQLFLRDMILTCFDLSNVNDKLAQHIQSYNRDEGKSNKQKHRNWATELRKKLEENTSVAGKFQAQVQRIFETAAPDYKQHLKSRIEAAKNYFSPVIQELKDDISRHKDAVKIEKKVRKYLKELTGLEEIFNNQLQAFRRAETIINSALENEEFSKEKIRQEHGNGEMSEEVPDMPSKINIGRSGKKKTARASGADKTSSRQISYELYLSGKSVAEIASAREMAQGTVESHLAHYVSTGLLSVEKFVDSEKTERIIAAAQTMESPFLGALKKALGDNYSWSEIRFAMAEYQRSVPEKK